MKAKELIEQLKVFPGDLEVYIPAVGCGCCVSDDSRREGRKVIGLQGPRTIEYYSLEFGETISRDIENILLEQ